MDACLNTFLSFKIFLQKRLVCYMGLGVGPWVGRGGGKDLCVNTTGKLFVCAVCRLVPETSLLSYAYL